jgi:hypothetical protein
MEYENTKGKKCSVLRPMEVWGVKGSTDSTLFIGSPDIIALGIVIDASTKRFGVKALQDDDGTPWFSWSPSTSNPAQSFVKKQEQSRPVNNEGQRPPFRRKWGNQPRKAAGPKRGFNPQTKDATPKRTASVQARHPQAAKRR